jgi:beta-galactosidase
VSLDDVSGREEFELAIYYEQKTIQESGKLQLLLYEGLHMKEISCCGADEKQLAIAIAGTYETEVEGSILTNLQGEKLIPGEISLYSTSFSACSSQGKGMKFSVSGRDVKILVMLNGKMLGRLWLPSEQVRPLFVGGNESLLYLPKSYIKEENRLDLLIEAMLGEPEITEVFIEEV